MAASDAFLHVNLTENDVPGAKFVYSSVEKHSNTQLTRWLECRGLKKSGNRSILLKRIHDCISAGQENEIDVSIDSGKWYDVKLAILKAGTSTQRTEVPLLPYSGWGKFPSCPEKLPKLFNKGHIHHHIVESVQFLNRQDIVDQQNDDFNIEDLHTSKPLKKGMTFYDSGHVQKIQDCVKSNHYFLKAKVMSSYRVQVFYDITVTLSQMSGFVPDASCTCVASSMGRCSHVCALLFALADFLTNCDNNPSSCTDVACTWNQGRKT